MTDAEEAAASPGFPAPVAFMGSMRIAWRLYVATIAPIFLPLLLIYGAQSFVRFALVLDMSRQIEIALGLFLELVVPLVVASFVFAALARMLTDELVGKQTSFTGSWEGLGSVSRDLLRFGLISGLISFALLFVLGPLQTFLYPLLMGPPVFVHVIALEGREGRDIAPRAKELLAGHWGSVVLQLLPATIAAGLLSIVLPSYLAGAVDNTGAADLSVAVGYLSVQPIAWALTFPFVAAAGVVAYLDLRARKDELDLEGLRSERNA